MDDTTQSKSHLWVWIALGMLVLVGLLTWWLWPTNQAVPAKTTPSLPSAGQLPQTGNGNASNMIVAGKSGSLTIPDFVHDGTTAADPQNPGTYYLAGSPCLSVATYPGCPQGARTNGFSIAYDEKPQFFTITLIAEPIGQARHEAEQFLQAKFGLSNAQLCSLNYYVGASYELTQQFSGKNLGFSFCPGATVLPQ